MCLALSLPVFAAAARADDALVAACKATDPTTSIEACSRLLDSHPSPDLTELAWRTRGFRLQTKGEHAKAVEDFTEALRLKPAYYGTLTARGTSYVRLNDFDQATADFDAALRLKPDFAPAFSGRSMLDVFGGHMDQAIADASEAIRLDPKQVAAYNNRGIALREKGDFDAALNDLNVAIRLSPYAARPLYNRGLTYFRKGDLEHALSDYDAALTLDAKETDARKGREVITAILAARGTADAPRGAVPPATAPQVTAPPPASPAPPVTAAAPSAAKAQLSPTSEGGSLGPADWGGEPALVPSRDPDAGTSWAAFAAPRLGVRLLVQEAQNPADRFVFSEHDDWIEVRSPGAGAGMRPTRVIRILNKPPGQPIEEAIADTFVTTLPPVGRDSCRVMRAEAPIDPGPGKLAFEIRPTGPYGRKMAARMKDSPDAGPGAMGCGTYGVGGATAYFEYHPDEDRGRYLYVFTGFEQPFDERSIKLVTPEVASSAVATPTAAVLATNDGPSSMAGRFAAPHRTLSVSPTPKAGELAVTLRVDMPGGCSGEAEGTGTGLTPYALTVSVPDPSGGSVCAIDMIYDRSYAAVQIKESAGCLTWHGAACDFAGRLTRRR